MTTRLTNYKLLLGPEYEIKIKCVCVFWYVHVWYMNVYIVMCMFYACLYCMCVVH